MLFYPAKHPEQKVFGLVRFAQAAARLNKTAPVSKLVYLKDRQNRS